MIRLTPTARSVLATAAALAGYAITLSAAHAQSFFDWNEEKKENGSGKQIVKFNTAAKPGDIIVSFSDRKLYFVTKPGEAISYPVATPRDQDRWNGTMLVSAKREKPSWTPTPSMRRENPRLPSWVPGGHPMNPLGVHALYLGSSLYRIHGTDAPWTIGTNVSKGCVRMYNQDAADLFPRAKIGTKVIVTWDKFKTGPGEDGAVVATTAPVQEPAKADAQRTSKPKSGITTAEIEPQNKPEAAEADATPKAREKTETAPQVRRRAPSSKAARAEKEKPKAKQPALPELFNI